MSVTAELDALHQIFRQVDKVFLGISICAILSCAAFPAFTCLCVGIMSWTWLCHTSSPHQLYELGTRARTMACSGCCCCNSASVAARLKCTAQFCIFLSIFVDLPLAWGLGLGLSHSLTRLRLPFPFDPQDSSMNAFAPNVTVCGTTNLQVGAEATWACLRSVVNMSEEVFNTDENSTENSTWTRQLDLNYRDQTAGALWLTYAAGATTLIIIANLCACHLTLRRLSILATLSNNAPLLSNPPAAVAIAQPVHVAQQGQYAPMAYQQPLYMQQPQYAAVHAHVQPPAPVYYPQIHSAEALYPTKPSGM